MFLKGRNNKNGNYFKLGVYVGGKLLINYQESVILFKGEKSF